MSNKWMPVLAILFIPVLFGCARKLHSATTSATTPSPNAPAQTSPTPSTRTTHEPLIPETPIKPKTIPANTLPMEMNKEK